MEHPALFILLFFVLHFNSTSLTGPRHLGLDRPKRETLFSYPVLLYLEKFPTAESNPSSGAAFSLLSEEGGVTYFYRANPPTLPKTSQFL